VTSDPADDLADDSVDHTADDSVDHTADDSVDHTADDSVNHRADDADDADNADNSVPDRPGVAELLAAGVAAVGGSERPGQLRMAEAVADAMRDGEHLLVQAGTGTGKSLAYLVPALLSGRRVVVTTATTALQDQLAGKDLPFLARRLDRLGTGDAVAIGATYSEAIATVR